MATPNSVEKSDKNVDIWPLKLFNLTSQTPPLGVCSQKYTELWDTQLESGKLGNWLLVWERNLASAV